MAIKSTVNTPAQKEITFPCLMQSKTNGQVVLFSSEDTGVVLLAGDASRCAPVGSYRDDWMNCAVSSVWQPIQSITLEMID